jgi:hypothetical protein
MGCALEGDCLATDKSGSQGGSVRVGEKLMTEWAKVVAELKIHEGIEPEK